MTINEARQSIDWTKFAEFQKPTVTCGCGAVFYSHTKHVWADDGFVGISQAPCPACGSDHDAVRVSHPPETMTITR